MFGSKCSDITVDTPENDSLLAQAGFDYDHTVKPLRLLGARSIQVSVFVSVECPNVELIPFLKTYGKIKSDALRRLYCNEDSFSHIKRGLHVAEFLSLDKDLLCKIVTNGVEIHFKYTGQPITCYRCGSTEQAVQTCPQKARLRPPLDTATRDPSTFPLAETMDSTPSNTGETTTPTHYTAAVTPSLFFGRNFLSCLQKISLNGMVLRTTYLGYWPCIWKFSLINFALATMEFVLFSRFKISLVTSTTKRKLYKFKEKKRQTN